MATREMVGDSSALSSVLSSTSHGIFFTLQAVALSAQRWTMFSVWAPHPLEKTPTLNPGLCQLEYAG